MNHVYRLAVLLLIGSFGTTAIAQPDPVGFQRKLKTGAPTPGLAERLNASQTPTPRTQATFGGFAEPAPFSAEVTGDLRVVRDPETGQPISVERIATSRPVTGAKARKAASVATYQFLNEVKTVLKVKSPEAMFQINRSETDELGQTHIRLTQTYAGLPVHGAELIAHLTDGEVTHVNGRYQTIAEGFNTTPALSAAQASQRAFQDVAQETVVRSFGQNIVNTKPVEENTLCLFETGAGPRLAYRLLIWPDLHQGWSYMIDAQTGAVLQKRSRNCTIDGPKNASARDLNGVTRTFSVYLKGNTYTTVDASRAMFSTKSEIPGNPIGCIFTADLNNTYGDKQVTSYVLSSNNTDWTPSAVSAHYNSGLVYDYFLNTHKRNSIDGKGGTIMSTINLADQKTGKGYDNAYWNGKGMYYGNGNVAFKPLAGGLDVAAHEMSHGVIQYTANLEYQGQSGALNESMADVFGVLIDRNNWTMGEDICQKSYYPTGSLRNMANPNQNGKGTPGYQPKTMSQYEKTDSDNGGVHINSGIPNYAFYLFATDVTREKAEKVYYRALTTYLTSSSQFLDMRLAIIKAATDLYGANGAEVTAAKKAFDTVGILDATQTTPKTDIPAAQGPDLALVAATSDARLYSTAISPIKFDVKTAAGVLQRASVTDNGQFAYYVSADKRIKAVSLTGTATEQVIQNETIWRNVAISRDGTKLAALTEQKDGSIWVYSFTLKQWNQFKLYTPTFTQDTQSSDAQYADSFEWDPTGDYLIFDEYNAIKSATGADISYWDVGIMRAWDGSKSQFGDGSIRKLFNSLPNGIDIGNPSFAKNSKSVIAFDYYDASDDSYSILAFDVATQALKKIYSNNTLGFPNYSRLDDRIVFSTLTGTRADVSYIVVGADKVTATGTLASLFINAKWPVWYTQATRATITRANQTLTFGPLADRFSDAAPQTLSATSSSGLPVSFAVTSGPAEVVGNQLNVTGEGRVTVRAYQDGSDQFYAATAVDQSFTVQLLLATEPAWADAVKLYPNPVGHTLTVELPGNVVVRQTQLKSLIGTVVPVSITGRGRLLTLDVSLLPTGMYFLQIDTDTGFVNRKVLKQ